MRDRSSVSLYLMIKYARLIMVLLPAGASGGGGAARMRTADGSGVVLRPPGDSWRGLTKRVATLMVGACKSYWQTM